MFRLFSQGHLQAVTPKKKFFLYTIDNVSENTRSRLHGYYNILGGKI
jgi:hypothetical protein